MKIVKILLIMILALACAFVSFACSNDKSPISPANDLPESFSASDSSQAMLASYDAVIDPAAKTFTVTPINRSAQYHHPLTQLYPNALQITDYGWTPNFWADIKLVHPFPGSGIDGFDPRVIAILPANPGVSFNYPALDAVANNSVVLEADGYTKLFDNLGGSIPGNTNPFKAYFKEQPFRVWSSTETTEETRRWQMDIAGFGGPLHFKLVVDVSTNYPNSPQPKIDNAPEPIWIEIEIGESLTQFGGTADIAVTLLDQQGRYTVGGVHVEAPDLFNGLGSLSFYSNGPNPYEYIYTGTIENSLLAPAGDYKMLVATWDITTDIYMYNEFSVSVIHATLEEGDLIWAKRVGGTHYDKGYGITTLSDNSTVVTGSFAVTSIFGPDEPNETVLIGAGSTDIFIARYNPNGTLAWAKRAGGTHYDKGRRITTLSDNTTVITGYFRGTATFGQDEPNETILTSAGGNDIFIARYNQDGTLAWAKRAGGTNYNYGYAITTLSDNSTVVTGGINGSATFGPGEPNQTVLTSTGGEDIFLAQYNPDGTLAGAMRVGGSGNDGGGSITTLSDDSIVVTGSIADTVIFGQDEPNETVLTSEGHSDVFIAQYNTDGTLGWAKRAGGWDYDGGGKITVLSDNSTVVTGFFHTAAIFGQDEPNQTVLDSAGYQDIFIARYNPDGTLAWAKRAGGTNGEAGYDITTLSDNATVITGEFYGLATFGQYEPNETLLDSAGDLDIFIARYNPDGTLQWAKQAGGTNFDAGLSITTLSDDTTAVTGYFSRSAIFGPDEPNETVLEGGSHDIFIARFEP